MSSVGFPTPAEEPDGFVCVRFFVPASSDVTWWANFRGAVLLLAEAESYVSVGTVTPEAAAAAWSEALALSEAGQDCDAG